MIGQKHTPQTITGKQAEIISKTLPKKNRTQKTKGRAVIYVGEDLDVLLALCDRILVLCGGQVSGVVDARTTDKRRVGTLMTRVEGGQSDE